MAKWLHFSGHWLAGCLGLDGIDHVPGRQGTEGFAGALQFYQQSAKMDSGAGATSTDFIQPRIMGKSNDLILASASPRRKDLLRALGYDFTVRATDVEEVLPKGLPARQAALYLAELKGKATESWLEPGQISLTADSVVLIEDTVLNKPSDKNEAIAMLSQLSDRDHIVVTGVCFSMRDDGGLIHRESYDVETSVRLASLTPKEISTYIDQWKPFDKAGSYGIQDWIGWAKVTSLVGSYSNVMGLPTAEVYASLQRLLPQA